jgi:hypothetical protein
MASIDLKTFQIIAKMVTPAPIAPLAPVDYNKGSESAFGMAKDIDYLRKSVDSIEKKLDRIVDTHVTLDDFKTRVDASDKIHSDHEERLRVQGTNITRIMTWGGVAWVFITLVMFALNYTK